MRETVGEGITGYTVLSRKTRYCLGIVFLVPVLAVLIGAGTMPFVFETGSILYKVGADKTFLRAGKVVGMIAASLLLLQLLLSARISFLDKIFALNRLYLIHRVNAVVIAVLAVIHPLLVFAPEDISSIPVELKYWPEILGAFLLVSIWLIMATGLWRLFLDFQFHRWWLFHRAAAFTAVVMLTFHVLYGSETFEAGTPRYIVIVAVALYVLLLGWVKAKPFLVRRKPFIVSKVEAAGQDACAVELTFPEDRTFSYVPGQFAFVTFDSKHLPSEEHPFTISSTPTRPESLQIVVRCSGDWTRWISYLRPGDTAYLDGPYGHFSYFYNSDHAEYLMIAGGIGITPILSMLRYMADADDGKKVTLIWSNRTKKEIICPDEFRELENTLNGLKIHYIFTRETDGPNSKGRITGESLRQFLTGCSRRAPVYICGPPLMMEDTKKTVIESGFSGDRIFMEEFSL